MPPGDHPDARPLVVERGEILLDGVTTRYPGAAAPVLRDLDLRVPAGGRLAVTGPSGSGKSTIVRLLTRQLDAERGTVSVDGQDLAGCTAASARDALTVVLQETMLLDATIRDNIALARRGATDAEIEDAARTAGAHDFITALPDGYGSRVGQRGRLLSGGQRQRLALARALLRRSPILVLDEPTTGLDDLAAERFLDALFGATERQTVIVMTHDPRVLPWVDDVVALAPLDQLPPGEMADLTPELVP